MPITAPMTSDGHKDGDEILKPTCTCLCPYCQEGRLNPRSYVRRHRRKEEDGEKEWLLIPVGKCDKEDCGRQCRILPDTMAPYKHYEEALISKVLDAKITESTPVCCPSIQTIRRWIAWFLLNMDRIEDIFRSIGCQIPGYNGDLPPDAESMLNLLREETDEWLTITIRLVYNSGNCLLTL